MEFFIVIYNCKLPSDFEETFSIKEGSNINTGEQNIRFEKCYQKSLKFFHSQTPPYLANWIIFKAIKNSL